MHVPHITIPPHDCQPAVRVSARVNAACRAAENWFSETLTIRQTFARLAPTAALTNAEFAALLRCSKGEASKLVSRHPKLLRRQRVGRHVRITIVR